MIFAEAAITVSTAAENLEARLQALSPEIMGEDRFDFFPTLDAACCAAIDLGDFTLGLVQTIWALNGALVDAADAVLQTTDNPLMALYRTFAVVFRAFVACLDNRVHPTPSYCQSPVPADLAAAELVVQAIAHTPVAHTPVAQPEPTQAPVVVGEVAPKARKTAAKATVRAKKADKQPVAYRSKVMSRRAS